MESTNRLWENFKYAFKDIISSFPINTLQQSWSSSTARNEFYFKTLFPKIALSLNFEYKTERPLRTDAIFWKRGGQTTELPFVYIESENTARNSHEEIYKLCCLSSKLKILFICNLWTTKEKDELVDGFWKYQIDDFSEANILTGNLCIVIAEWTDRLRFYSHCYNENAILFEDDLLIEI